MTRLRQSAGSDDRWSAARWNDTDVARAAVIYKREITERHGKWRLPRGERQRAFALIAAELKRTIANVANRFNNYGESFSTVPSGHRALSQKMGPKLQPASDPRAERWSAQEIEIAANIWAKEVTDLYGDDEPPRGLKERVIHDIAAKLGRKFWSVEARLRLQGSSFGVPEAIARARSSERAPSKLFIERAARDAARRNQDITGALFGDPPPGFSALDRRRNP